jgi:hypothetical protein
MNSEFFNHGKHGIHGKSPEDFKPQLESAFKELDIINQFILIILMLFFSVFSVFSVVKNVWRAVTPDEPEH